MGRPVDIRRERMRLMHLADETRWPMWKVEALYRVAKTTPFFRDPKMMMALRWHVERRRQFASTRRKDMAA